jgi:hypothetical protein
MFYDRRSMHILWPIGSQRNDSPMVLWDPWRSVKFGLCCPYREVWTIRALEMQKNFETLVHWLEEKETTSRRTKAPPECQLQPQGPKIASTKFRWGNLRLGETPPAWLRSPGPNNTCLAYFERGEVNPYFATYFIDCYHIQSKKIKVSWTTKTEGNSWKKKNERFYKTKILWATSQFP